MINDPTTPLGKPVINIDSLNSTDLIALRENIDKSLKLGINELNLDEELSLQYRQAKRLYEDVYSSTDTPANQKAQVLNTISAILVQISKTQIEINSVERHKKIEAATLAAVKDLPIEAKEAFFRLLKGYLLE